MNKVVDSLRAVNDMVRHRTSQKSCQSFDDLFVVSNKDRREWYVEASPQRI